MENKVSTEETIKDIMGAIKEVSTAELLDILSGLAIEEEVLEKCDTDIDPIEEPVEVYSLANMTLVDKATAICNDTLDSILLEEIEISNADEFLKTMQAVSVASQLAGK